jgi:hypothetical protein
MRNDRCRSFLHISFAVGMVVSLSGCGVMFGGTTKTIQVVSAPVGANITTTPASGTFTTPTALTLERKHSYTIVATKDGYSDAQFQIRKSMRSGPLILDILFTGLLGVIVDAATGGWWELKPEDVTMTLEKTDSSVPGPDTIEVTFTPVESVEGSFAVDAPEVVKLELIAN